MSRMRWRGLDLTRLSKSRPDPDPAASMALLNEVRDRPLDPGYASAAAARRERGLPASTGSHSLLLVVSMVLLGFLLTVAAQTLREPDPAAATAREELIERVGSQQQLGDTHAVRIEVLRADVAALQEAAIQGPDAERAEAVQQAAIQAGASAMVGPGVVVTMDDAPTENDALAAEAEERVLARDLQVVVNGLWAQGAEAIAINEQRLTSTSSIRFAGEAIVVDFRGLTRPYTVTAIGDPDQLLEELGSGPTGQYLAELRDEFHLSAAAERAAEVTVPAATRLSTRLARVPGAGTTEEDER
jgi:uncharacterized protein YlxW (UPF0749 family)